MTYFRADQTDQLEGLAPHGPKNSISRFGRLSPRVRGFLGPQKEAAGELTPRVRGVGATKREAAGELTCSLPPAV